MRTCVGKKNGYDLQYPPAVATQELPNPRFAVLKHTYNPRPSTKAGRSRFCGVHFGGYISPTKSRPNRQPSRKTKLPRTFKANLPRQHESRENTKSLKPSTKRLSPPHLRPTQLNLRRHRHDRRKEYPRRVREPNRANLELLLLFRAFSALVCKCRRGRRLLIDAVEHIHTGQADDTF